MHEELKRELDESVPKHIVLTEEKKRKIMMAAQERTAERKPSRVPKFIPAIVTIAVIGLSGVLVYPYLLGEEADTPTEIRSGEESPTPPAGSDKDPGIIPAEEEEPEKLPENEEEETMDAPATDHTPDTHEDTPQDEAVEQKSDTENGTVDVEMEVPPLSKKQQFVNLLDHQYFRTGIRLGDEVAKLERDFPNWVSKGPNEGGVTILYGDFAVTHGYFETEINHVILLELGSLTVAQIEEAIGQEIAITPYFNNIENREINHGEFVLDNEAYAVEAASTEKDARVERIIIGFNYLE